jgi:hypothetical protein
MGGGFKGSHTVTNENAIACPVAELEREILDTMDRKDAALRDRKAGPALPAAHEQLLSEALEIADLTIAARREIATRTLATSLAGLRYQTEELLCAHDELLDDDSGDTARKVGRLVELIAKAARNLSPPVSPLIAA